MKFLKKVISKIKSAFGFGMGMIQNHGLIAVEITEHLKTIVRSQVVRSGVRIIPGKFAGKLFDFLEQKAIPILEEVCLILGIIRQNERGSLAFKEIIERLQALDPSDEARVYQEFAARFNYRLADGVFSLKECWDQAQDIWFTFFKKK